MFEYKGVVRQVIDGDTLVIDVDLGFRVIQTMVFRLYGINTPEVVGEQKAKGLEAKNYVISELAKFENKVIIKTYKDKKEKYGRFLADVYYPDEIFKAEFRSLNKALVDKGLATEYFGVGEKEV